MCFRYLLGLGNSQAAKNLPFHCGVQTVAAWDKALPMPSFRPTLDEPAAKARDYSANERAAACGGWATSLRLRPKKTSSQSSRPIKAAARAPAPLCTEPFRMASLSIRRQAADRIRILGLPLLAESLRSRCSVSNPPCFLSCRRVLPIPFPSPARLCYWAAASAPRLTYCGAAGLVAFAAKPLSYFVKELRYGRWSSLQRPSHCAQSSGAR